MSAPRRWLVAAAPLLLACGGGAGGASHGSSTLTVFGAASLRDAFTAIADDFEAANPGVNVDLNFAGSSTLREQILAGAPADVFAAADESNVAAVVDGGEAVGESATFVTNQLQIAVPAGNPAGVTGLADFADPRRLIGLCADTVPCGELGHRVLANAGVEPSIDTAEPDVRSLMTRLEAGELDAGIVYRSDVLASAGEVDGIEIPPEANVTARYPIVALSAAGRPFVEFVLSAPAQAVLRMWGFTGA
ncbi:MAG: molybdate ABC transporter substrate-binding protein [Acidimicrobiales bacterium]